VLELKKYPQNYLNKYIKVNGKVVEENEIGLWITLQDNYIIVMTFNMLLRIYKKKVDFTIDEDVFNEFRNYCKKNNISMSGKVESLIRGELKNNRR